MDRIGIPRRALRSAARGAVTAAFLCAASPGSAQEAPPPGFDEGIFQLSIAELPQVTVPALLSHDGVVLVPLRPVLQGAGIPFERDGDRLLLRMADAERRPLSVVVDPGTRRVVRGDTGRTAGRDEMVVYAGDVFLAPEPLAFLLRADVAVDFGRLDVRVTPLAPFPAHIALDTERRRRLAGIRLGRDTDRLPDAPLRPLSGGGVVRYAASAGVPDPVDASVVTLEGGFALLGGEAVLGYTGSPGGATVADPALSGRYERYIPGSDWISFIRAGDVTADAAFARFVRGATVTNRPLRRGVFFQDLVLAPDLPPGWELEVYRGGQLIGFTDPTAPGGVPVPLTYGRSDLEVRMIGPAGEIVRSDLLLTVPEAQLPQGRLEYSAGGGRCHIRECTLAFADADWGVTRWLTLGGGSEFQSDSAGRRVRPFASALLARPGGWVADARFVAGRLLSGSLRRQRPGGVTGSVGFDVRSPEVGQVTVLPQTDTRWTVRGDAGLRRSRLSARMSGLEGDGVDGWGTTLTTGIPQGVASVELESLAGQPTSLSLSAFRLLDARWGEGRFTTSGRVSLRQEGVGGAQLGLGGTWRERFFASAAVQWDRDYGFSATLSFNRQFAVGQVGGLATAVGGDARASLRADGAVALDPRGGAVAAGYTGIGFAGIDVRAFYDANGNGVWDESEAPVAGLPVQAGDRFATSDSSGHARVWGLVPFEKTAVRPGADWPDPRWTPADTLYVVRPVPHVFNTVAIPLVGTRELLALVEPGPEVRTAAGLRFTLTHAHSGRVFEGMTLMDGTLYVSQVPVGRYTLRFEEADLDALGAVVVGAPLQVDVTADGPDEFVVELPPIRLRRAAPR